ncbi:uncharacterized protein LOC113516829 [Galleria mellonella]|uniref:Uncharacterized protein LOC113516829 n=1 Tax=Galleria mellonella TaxID=7137 RepID=A0A6J3BTX1_GALME|nr:uncharacterized protein LOC113516829 [Galleria mellonella]
MLCTLALFVLFASAQGRAVNISNTWVLPEEGFPVFYRYFRDRISWYEADAVCQFHHANLVTVDTTAQYDAVRAYLKELDISSAVWVGLIRSNPDGDFTWTDYRGLSSDGYWSSAPDPRAAPLCAAADPVADYRWEARACGGPTVASFICELPVPQWALGNEGCMIRALPALTILYLPESASVQLTADCGMAGVKRVQCTGNVKREDLLKDLSCAEEEEQSTTSNVITTSVTWPVTTDTSSTDQDIITELTTEETITTEHEDDINQVDMKSSAIPYNLHLETGSKILQKPVVNKVSQVILNKNINLEAMHSNNLQSNEIPKIASHDSYLNNDENEKMEDEKNKQHKIFHDEIARLGNFETIFTQPTDHFVPPLVMARSKISDDMTVLSLEEKHAQQLAEQTFGKYKTQPDDINHSQINYSTSRSPTEYTSKFTATDMPLIMTMNPIKIKDTIKKEPKNSVPKKYIDKQYDLKSKLYKVIDTKQHKIAKSTEITSIQTESTVQNTETTTKVAYKEDKQNKIDEDPSIDLTVIIRDFEDSKTYAGDVPKIEIIENDTSITNPEIKFNTNNTSGEKQQEISVKIPASIQNSTLTHEIIKITIINEENSSAIPAIFEVSTKMPDFNKDYENKSTTPAEQLVTVNKVSNPKNQINKTLNNKSSFNITNVQETTITIPASESVTLSTMKDKIYAQTTENSSPTTSEVITSTESQIITTTSEKNYTHGTNNNTSEDTTITSMSEATTKEIDVEVTETSEFEHNTTDTSETIDDFQSPLLSAANEPLHRPNRSRRPQQPLNRINKFNPFRILG